MEGGREAMWWWRRRRRRRRRTALSLSGSVLRVWSVFSFFLFFFFLLGFWFGREGPSLLSDIRLSASVSLGWYTSLPPHDVAIGAFGPFFSSQRARCVPSRPIATHAKGA
jgi:hypothetical protein